jgi:hypothetical protein
MPITLICPSCSARLKAPETAVGKTVKCPKCGLSMAVTAPAEPPSDVVETVFEVEEQPAAPRPARSRRDDDELPRPRRKKKSSTGLIVGLVLGLGGLLAVCLCGGGVAYYITRNVVNPNVTKENYDRLHEGMTMAEIEAILGSGSQSNAVEVQNAYSHAGPGAYPPVGQMYARAFGSGAVYRWKNGDDILIIVFSAAPNAGGTLKYKLFQQKTGPNSYNTDSRGNVN